jgi:ribosomal protein S18 acetylase RimI-like enzyme
MLQLRATTQAEFDAYIHKAIDHLANELSEAKDIPKPAALEIARGSFDDLFPEGRVDAPDQYFFDLVEAGGAKAGFIHFGIRREDGKPYAYIWDFEIYESFRGMGHAQAALAATEKKAAGLGLGLIKLNVFGHNVKARRLYQKCGYREMAITMGKNLQ